METSSAAQPQEQAGQGYTGAPVAGAALATLAFPFLSLIGALMLQGSQTDARKKAQLRTWAWASGGWMVLWLIVVVALASSVSGSPSVSRSGPCEGGPKMGSAGTQIPGHPNEFLQPCEFGGSQTITFPSTTP